MAGVNADIGGIALLVDLVTPLSRWGLGYLAVGALLGLARLTPLGRLGPLVGWLLLVALADEGVAPRWLSAALVLVAHTLPPLGVRLCKVGHRFPNRALATNTLENEPPDRRRSLVQGWALLGLAVVLLLGSLPTGVSRPPIGVPGAGPNVVLVVVDTLRADHVGAYGYARPTTPAVDRLAAEGLRFEHARANASWTLPSHGSLFTGLLPSEHGAHAAHPTLGDGPATLAQAFDERGYRTVGLSANAWVSAGTGLDRGFERFHFLGADGISSQLLLPLVFSAPEDLGGRSITDHAVQAIADAARADEPLFLFANYLEAHEPLGTIPEPARSRFSEQPVDPGAGRRWVRELPLFWCACEADRDPLRCEDGLFRAPAPRVRQTIDQYDAGVAYVDARIGELRAALERVGQLDNTVFVVTSDHGEHLGEDGRLGHMVWLTEPLLRVPLVVRYPPALTPGVEREPIDLAHLHDWLLALTAGTPLPPPPARLVAESHPHPAALRDRWGTLFQCDFGPAGLGRTRIHDKAGTVDGGAPVTDLAPDGELSPRTRAALEALGYLQ